MTPMSGNGGTVEFGGTTYQVKSWEVIPGESKIDTSRFGDFSWVYDIPEVSMTCRYERGQCSPLWLKLLQYGTEERFRRNAPVSYRRWKRSLKAKNHA